MKRAKTIIKNLPTVQNMQSSNGNDIPNQFEIFTNDGKVFQSYSSTIAIITDGQIILDRDKWNYSRTTSKYRNLFLGETTKETQNNIDIPTTR